MRDALILLLDKFFKIKHDRSLRGKLETGGWRTAAKASLVPYLDKDRQEKINKTRIFNAIVKKIYHVKAAKYYKNW